MLGKRIDKIYGIDYDRYICGGIGSQKIKKFEEHTVLFYTEPEMLKTLAELKENNAVEITRVFTSEIHREDYKI